jgi:hypothetical protein
MYLTYIHAGERPAMGETETEKGPVDLSPGERVRQGWRTPDFPSGAGREARKGRAGAQRSKRNIARDG